MNYWNQQGVPHRGWKCIDVVDLGSGNSESCEMCGNENVRFLHYMEHPEHAVIVAGCICAEKMSGDYINPRKLEKTLHNRAKRRETFMRGTWSISAKGNSYIRFKGTLLTVYRTQMGHYGIISCSERCPIFFKSVEDAKIASFDFYEKVTGITQHGSTDDTGKQKESTAPTDS